MKLREKQKRFCEEYLIDLNATKACIRAGYSKKTAGEMGYENLNKPHLQAYIQQLQGEIKKRNRISIDSILNRINNTADNAEEDKDKLKALDMLMRHLGGYTADNTVDNKVEVTYKVVS